MEESLDHSRLALWNEEEDSIVVVAPAYVRQFIEAIERTFKEIQSR
jgi:hypothetical protein